MSSRTTEIKIGVIIINHIINERSATAIAKITQHSLGGLSIPDLHIDLTYEECIELNALTKKIIDRVKDQVRKDF